MTTQETKNANQEFYINHQSKPSGYIQRARFLTTKGGQEDLHVDVIGVTGLITNPKDDKQWAALNRVQYSTKVVGRAAIQIVTDHMDAINDDDISTWVRTTIGIEYTDPYTHVKGPKVGKPDAAIKSRLLYIAHLKLDGQVIDLEPYNGKSDQHTDNSHDQVSDGSSSNEDTNGEPDQSNDNVPATDQPNVVKLSKDDPDFETRKQQLKDEGYRWDRNQTAWVLIAA